MRNLCFLGLIFLTFVTHLTSCGCRRHRSNTPAASLNEEKPETIAQKVTPTQTKGKIGKAIFFLENSGSMFGFVNGFTEYVDVVSELTEKPTFAEEKTLREFFFVNGDQELKITYIGNNPADLKDKLNVKGFNCGDISKSDLNAMFQLALSKAKKDTISILISDGIYDIGSPTSPLNKLSTEGRETRSRFIERLNEGHLQTIIIKLISHFDGKYFASTGGSIKLQQHRPFYVWIFGKTELLNNYFPNEYIKSLNGYSNFARFLKMNQLNVAYQATAYNKIGNFKFDKRNKNKLIRVKTDRNGKGFQFTIAVDYSGLPFSNTYLTTTSNYFVNHSKFSIQKISRIGDIKLYGLNFTPTHLITIATNENPICQLEISLKYMLPDWIEKTNIDTERNIIGDTSHTFGFKFLTDAICEAYQYKNKESYIATFQFDLVN